MSFAIQKANTAYAELTDIVFTTRTVKLAEQTLYSQLYFPAEYSRFQVCFDSGQQMEVVMIRKMFRSYSVVVLLYAHLEAFMVTLGVSGGIN